MRIALLLICLTTGLNAHSQSWFPNGATWTYDYANFILTGYVSHEVSGDTLLDDRLCKVIDRTRSYTDGFGVYTLELEPYCVLDSAGIVWIHVPDEGLDTLYVMGAAPGDGWMLAEMPEECDSTSYLVVVDTGHVVINGISLRWLAVDMHYPEMVLEIWQDTIVERLGTLRSYLPPQDRCLAGFDGAEGGLLRCYNDLNVSYMMHQVTACELNLGLEPLGGTGHLSLFPDPATGRVRIDWPGRELSTWQLSTVMGTVASGGSRNIAGPEFNALGLVAGMYLLTVFDDQGTSAHLKWIKP